MSGARGGVALDIRVTADGAKEKLEEIGAAGSTSLQRITEAATAATTATSGISGEVAKIPDALAPATAATGALVERTRQLTTASQANVVSIQAAAEARARNVAAMQSETVAINSQASAAQRLTTVAGGAAGTIGTLVDVGTQLANTSGSASSILSTVSGFVAGFGPAGAAAAAALGLVSVAAGRIEAASERAEAASKAAFDSMELGGRNASGVIDGVAEAFNNAARGAGALATAQRDALAQTVQVQQRQLVAVQESQQIQLEAANARVQQLEVDAANEQALADQRRRQYGGRNAPLAPAATALSTVTELYTARNEVTALNRELDRTRQLMGQAAQAAQQLEENLPLPPDAPGAPERTRAAAAGRAQLTEAEREYQQVMNQAEQQVTRTLSLEQQREATLERLRASVAAGGLTEEKYSQAVEATGRAMQATRNEEARRTAERDAEKATRENERAAQQLERSNQTATDNIVRYASDRFADLFDKNKGGWKAMLQTFESTAKSTVSRIAAELVLRPIISPIVSGLGLGSISGRSGLEGAGVGGFNLAGIFGGGAPVASTAGSTSAALQSGQQSAGLSAGGRLSGLSGITSYGGLANSGFRGVDNFLNTPVSSSSEIVGSFGSQTYNGLPVADSIGMNGATYGNVLSGGAAVAGGAYGIYSGIQKGGVGGTVGAVGGAVSMASGASIMGMLGPSMAALGPYGLIAAAVLAIVSALLPGQKASGKGQEFRVDLLSGDTEKNGLGGSRYSAENASQAEAAARSISGLASNLSTALGGARIPGEAAVGVTSSRGDGPGQLYLEVSGRKAQFANDEDGAKQLADKAAEFLLEAFRGAVSGDFVGILNASPTVEKLQENLTWYDQVYKKFGQTAEAASAFAQQQDQVRASFQTNIDKANELALATDKITEARDKELAKLVAARDLNLRAYGIGLDIRMANATGNGGLDAQLAAFDIQAEQQMADARKQLEDWGAEATLASELIAKNEATLGAERLKIQRDFNAEATAAAQQAAEEQVRIANQAGAQITAAQIKSAQSVIEWLNSQMLGADSSLSPTAKLAEAERQFREAQASGDTGALTSSASTLLGISREVLGGATSAYAQRESFVRQSVAQAGLRNAAGAGDAPSYNALAQIAQMIQDGFLALAKAQAEATAENRRANSQALAQ